MGHNIVPFWRRVIILVATFSVFLPAGWAQKRQLTADEQREASEIAERERRGNGIVVYNPKVYDDSSLQLMLNAARARLATIQAIDQTGLLSRIGAISGASLSQSALGVSFTGPPIPGSVVTNNAPTGTTTTNSTASGGSNVVVGASPTTTTTTANGNSTQVVTNLPVQGTVTTNAAQAATVPALPANGGLTLPTASVSALDALNEQMQLTYEIANLRLLLEGSLNDRYVKGTRIIKPKTTLGFPITITPLPEYKNAIAVVEVEVENPDVVFDQADRPAVTALLPREKTYNVAQLSDHMTSIGAGVVTQVLNGGFSFLRGRKSYYVVQDQDTVAVMLPQRQSKPDETAFAWHFRPVLGQPFVRGGLKQTFVQLAAPLRESTGCFGRIKVTSYWRRIDRKSGALKEIIENSVNVSRIEPTIPAFDLSPVIADEVKYDDLGSGQVRVTVGGRFLDGVYVRVGNLNFGEGSSGFSKETNQIRFVAAAADIAKYRAYLVSRDGKETEILDPSDPADLQPLTRTCWPRPESGFALMPEVSSEASATAGQAAKFNLRITTAETFNQTVNLAAVLPAGIGPAAWSSAAISSPPNSATRTILTVGTGAATPPGNYTIQINANSLGLPTQIISVVLHVSAAGAAAPVGPLAAIAPPTLTPSIEAYDESKSIVTATLANVHPNPGIQKYLLRINDRIFGLSDAPVQRDATNNIIRAIVPNNVLNGATEIQALPLFWKDEKYTAKATLAPASVENINEKILVFDQTGDPIVFLLFGSRLYAGAVVSPAGIALSPVGTHNISTLAKFTLAKSKWGDIKQIVLQKSASERPIFVDLPSPDGPPKITLVAGSGGSIGAGTDELVVTGADSFDELSSVTFNKAPIKFTPDGKSVKLKGLVSSGVTAVAGEPTLVFEFPKNKRATLKLAVVTSKVEVIPNKP
jgi:hypothetical protein